MCVRTWVSRGACVCVCCEDVAVVQIQIKTKRLEHVRRGHLNLFIIELHVNLAGHYVDTLCNNANR
jgi:hypothetical protein